MLQKNDNSKSVSSDADTNGQQTPSLLTRLLRFFAQTILMGLVLLAAYLATMRLVDTKPEVTKRPVFPTVYTVETVFAKAENHQPILSLYGEVLAGRSVDLRSLVAGEIISVNDKLKIGETIKKGATLIEIDRFNFEGALREAKANTKETQARILEADARVKSEKSRLASASEQLELAKNDLSRILKLKKNGTANEKQVDDRKFIVSQRKQSVEQSKINLLAENAKIDQLNAALDRLKWKTEQSEHNLSNTKLIAPFTGTIRTYSAEVGKLTSVNDVVVSMYQADNLEVRFILTDERYGRMLADKGGIIGKKLQVLWNVGGVDYVYPAKIVRIGAEIASTRGGVELFAKIGASNNNVALRPGAFVGLRIPDKTYSNHIKLPDSALYNSDTVYVVKDGKLEPRKVTVAAFDRDSILISKGISETDEILTTRIAEISPGLNIRKENDPIKTPDNSSSESAN